MKIVYMSMIVTTWISPFLQTFDPSIVHSIGFTLVAFSSTMERPNTYTGRVVRGLSRQSQNGKNATGSLSGAGFHPIEPLQISQNRKSMDIFTTPLKIGSKQTSLKPLRLRQYRHVLQMSCLDGQRIPQKNEHGDFQGVQPHHKGDSSVEPPRQDLSLEIGPSWLWLILQSNRSHDHMDGEGTSSFHVICQVKQIEVSSQRMLLHHLWVYCNAFESQSKSW